MSLKEQDNQTSTGKEYCPECDALVLFDYDGDEETACEDCGSHSAVHCNECDEVFDHVWGYTTIEDYQKERKVTERKNKI